MSGETPCIFNSLSNLTWIKEDNRNQIQKKHIFPRNQENYRNTVGKPFTKQLCLHNQNSTTQYLSTLINELKNKIETLKSNSKIHTQHTLPNQRKYNSCNHEENPTFLPSKNILSCTPSQTWDPAPTICQARSPTNTPDKWDQPSKQELTQWRSHS